MSGRGIQFTNVLQISEHTMEDFLSPRFLDLELLFLNPKLCLVMKIGDSQVPTTKQSLGVRLSLSRLSNQTDGKSSNVDTDVCKPFFTNKTSYQSLIRNLILI